MAKQGEPTTLVRYRTQTGDQMRSGSRYGNLWQRYAARPCPQFRHRRSWRTIGVLMIERQLIVKTPENHRNRQPNKSKRAKACGSTSMRNTGNLPEFPV
jgi:hypothetical protein